MRAIRHSEAYAVHTRVRLIKSVRPRNYATYEFVVSNFTRVSFVRIVRIHLCQHTY